VREGIQSRLREVEETSQADDESIDLAKGREAEDFGGVIPKVLLAH
jgi:hypothetical protein